MLSCLTKSRSKGSLALEPRESLLFYRERKGDEGRQEFVVMEKKCRQVLSIRFGWRGVPIGMKIGRVPQQLNIEIPEWEFSSTETWLDTITNRPRKRVRIPWRDFQTLRTTSEAVGGQHKHSERTSFDRALLPHVLHCGLFHNRNDWGTRYRPLSHDTWDIECKYGLLECKYRTILHWLHSCVSAWSNDS